MTIKYGKFELPNKIKVEEPEEEGGLFRVVAEPFERGFGHTLGNALRRILLTSLESPSIVSVMMDGVLHEYMSVEGIVEDIPYIVINLKKSLISRSEDMIDNPRKISSVSKTIEVKEDMLLSSNGQYPVTLGEIFEGSEYGVVNPEQVIFNVTTPMVKNIFLRVGVGRGYVPSERSLIKDRHKNEILMDANFSPVSLVNYFVENCRVGGETDMDRLVFEIKTDGRISVKEAIGAATQILNLHLSIFEQLEFESIVCEEEEEEEEVERDGILNKLKLKINEIELSVRSTNCLIQANVDTIGELVVMNESDMLKFRNFGKKSLNEIKSKLEDMGLSLGMDLKKYGIGKKESFGDDGDDDVA